MFTNFNLNLRMGFYGGTVLTCLSLLLKKTVLSVLMINNLIKIWNTEGRSFKKEVKEDDIYLKSDNFI